MGQKMDAKIEKMIASYKVHQTWHGTKNRLARMDADGFLLRAIPDDPKLVDVFIDLAKELLDSLGEIYFSGWTIPTLSANTMSAEGSIRYGDVEEGEQLIHCNLWEKDIGYYITEFCTGRNILDREIRIDPRGQEPLVSVYIPKPSSYQSHHSIPGEELIDKIKQDAKIVTPRGRGYTGDRGYLLSPNGDLYIQKFLRKEFT